MSIGNRLYFQATSDQTWTNDDILRSISGLTLPVTAGRKVAIRGTLFFRTSSGGGINVVMAVPAIARAKKTGVFWEPQSITADGRITVAADFLASGTIAPPFSPSVTNSECWFAFEASFVIGASAGNITVQAAQDSADPSPLTILQESYMDVILL